MPSRSDIEMVFQPCTWLSEQESLISHNFKSLNRSFPMRNGEVRVNTITRSKSLEHSVHDVFKVNFVVIYHLDF